MERLERCVEFALKGGTLANGYKFIVATGEHLKDGAAAQGVKMTTVVKDPKLGTWTNYNKVDPKRSYHGQRRKPYTEIGMIHVPIKKPGFEELPFEDRPALRGTFTGGKSASNLSDFLMRHHAKNKTRLKYDPLPMASEGEPGIVDVEKLNQHYIKGAAKSGFRYRSGGAFGQHLLLPPKKQE